MMYGFVVVYYIWYNEHKLFVGSITMNINMKYYNVYYFCHLANESMGKFDFVTNHGMFLDSYYNIEAEDFPKTSVLWHYCLWLINSVIREQAEIIGNDDNRYDFDPFKCVQGAILKYRNFDITEEGLKRFFCKSFIEEENNDCLHVFTLFIDELENNFDGLYYSVVEDIATELEFILFQNRDFLLRFNEMVSAKFYDNIRTRVYIPEWVKRAVLFRDKGCCVFCKKDLTGICTLLQDNEKHFDHIMPLDKGGINDVCNIQLSCKECNLKKATKAKTSTLYQRAY